MPVFGREGGAVSSEDFPKSTSRLRKCPGFAASTPFVMHSKKTIVPTCRAAFSAALAAFLASAAGAVSLGDLKVESAPGEPFDAVLEIHDVDLSVSPLLVRIAPAATYEREGIEPPEAAGSLRLTRDANPGGVRVRVAGDAVPEGRFPLLIELNAGGAVTLRRYEVVSGPEGLRVESVAESTRLGGAVVPVPIPDATAAKASSVASSALPASSFPSTEPKAEKVEKIEKATAKPRKKGRYGPRVVREYVALNGFDAYGTFPIRQDMTFWSIAKLYWPRYEGATMEQLAVGFLEANPEVFMQGDLNLLVVGETLVPPSEEAVFAIDPEEAFRRMRGATEAIPLSTRNLAEAQMVSRECAAAVGAAQNAKRDAGGSALEIGEAGRQVFEEYKAKLALQRELQGDVNAGKPAVLHGGTLSKSLTEGAPSEEPFPVKSTGEGVASTSNAVTAPITSNIATTPSFVPVSPTGGSDVSVPVESVAASSAESSAEPSVESAAPSETSATTSTTDVAGSAASSVASATAEVPKGVAEDAPKDSAKNAEQAADRKDFLSMLFAVPPAWYLLAVIVVVLLFLLRGRKSARGARASSAAGGSCASEGCGAKGPQTVQLQKNVAPTSAAQLKAVEATVGEAVKNGTTAGAMGVGSIAFTEAQMEEDRKKIEARTAEQPWLDPKSDELPPVDEEAMRATVSEAAIEEAVSKIDLTLPNADARPTVVVTEEELPANDYIPPLMPEPVGSEKTEESEKNEKTVESEGSTLVVEVESQRDTLQKPVLRPASVVPPSLSGGALPPESEARIEAIAKAAAQSVEDIPAPAAAPSKSRSTTRRSRRSAEPKSSVPAAPKALAPNAKEEALGKSIEAKLKLANSFVGLGALQEARELLVEVKKHGTPEQKARAEFLEKRIGKA